MAHYQYQETSQTINKGFLANSIEKLVYMHPFYQYISQNTSLYEIFKLKVLERNHRKMANKRLGFNYLMPKSDLEAFEKGYKIWKRSVENIYSLTKNDNTYYLLVIQPNQYQENSKILSEKEKELYVTKNNQHIFYRIAKKDSFSLRAANVVRKFYRNISPSEFKIPKENLLDLRMIFKNNNQTLYMDACCHFNDKGMNSLSDDILKKIFLEYKNL